MVVAVFAETPETCNIRCGLSPIPEAMLSTPVPKALEKRVTKCTQFLSSPKAASYSLPVLILLCSPSSG